MASRYIGSGPYCYANCLAMAMADGIDPLVWFAVRRLADAGYWLGQIGLTDAAAITGTQPRLVGDLQYPLVAKDDARVATLLRDLAPMYGQLSWALNA